MDNPPEPSTSPPSSAPRPWARQILHFPITRLVLALTMVLGFVLVVQLALQAALIAAGENQNPYLKALGACIVAACACLSYAAYVRLIEWRPVTELSRPRAVREFLSGVLLGAGLISTTVGILALLGRYRVSGFNAPLVLIAPFCLGLLSGFLEEIVARAILFRIVEEWLGSWLALILSASLFGLAHAGNPGATLGSCLAIALEAGILLAAAFMLTRRLWLPAGTHAAWNFSQSGMFGIATSGNKAEGLLRAEITGPDWLTGGAFGAESSPIAVLVCTAAGAVLLILAIRRGRVVPPIWRRKRSLSVTAGAAPIGQVT